MPYKNNFILTRKIFIKYIFTIYKTHSLNFQGIHDKCVGDVAFLKHLFSLKHLSRSSHDNNRADKHQ